MAEFRRLLPYIQRYQDAFLLGLGCVIVTSAIVLLSPWVLKFAIDDLTMGVTRRKLALYGTVLLGLACIGGFFRFLMRRILVGASRDIEYDIRNDFFAKLELFPLAYYQARRTGDLMSRATNDLNAVRMMIGPAIMYSANTIIVFVVAVLLMLSIDPWLTGIALLPLPFISISVKFFGGAIHRGFEQVQGQLSDISAVVQESLSGVRVVRAYRQEQAEIQRFADANQEYVRRNRQVIRVQGMFFPTIALFLGLAALLVLWLGSREVIGGRMSLGELVAFNAYLERLTWPMIAFGWVTNMLQRGMASWKRILEILDAEVVIRDQGLGGGEAPAAAATSASAIRGDIELRNLTFAYNGHIVLDGISAHIQPGETVAIVGMTGAGKSTLVNLLARLHDPPPGTVFIDGMDVRQIPLTTLRGAIGFVPQEPFLFSDTVLENVAFGASARLNGGDEVNRAAMLDVVERASAVARLDKDVETFPRRYDTMVGERGITLSGGQKQRTAIARALFVDPRILILDDALSAVDTYTEEEILSRLRGVMRQRTSIIISHRISTVRDADQIFVLNRGRLVECGQHQELIEHGGLYSELYRKQLLEEELAAS
jgi:ATP-binding cassette, subfamily B, multidrug efflux pump